MEIFLRTAKAAPDLALLASHQWSVMAEPSAHLKRDGNGHREQLSGVRLKNTKMCFQYGRFEKNTWLVYYLLFKHAKKRNGYKPFESKWEWGPDGGFKHHVSSCSVLDSVINSYHTKLTKQIHTNPYKSNKSHSNP